MQSNARGRFAPCSFTHRNCVNDPTRTLQSTARGARPTAAIFLRENCPVTFAWLENGIFPQTLPHAQGALPPACSPLGCFGHVQCELKILQAAPAPPGEGHLGALHFGAEASGSQETRWPHGRGCGHPATCKNDGAGQSLKGARVGKLLVLNAVCACCCGRPRTMTVHRMLFALLANVYVHVLCKTVRCKSWADEPFFGIAIEHVTLP